MAIPKSRSPLLTSVPPSSFPILPSPVFEVAKAACACHAHEAERPTLVPNMEVNPLTPTSMQTHSRLFGSRPKRIVRNFSEHPKGFGTTDLLGVRRATYPPQL